MGRPFGNSNNNESSNFRSKLMLWIDDIYLILKMKTLVWAHQMYHGHTSDD